MMIIFLRRWDLIGRKIKKTNDFPKIPGIEAVNPFK